MKKYQTFLDLSSNDILKEYCNINDEYVIFWHGPFSQWWPSEFVVSSVTYNCCEQFMMAQKALLFDDDATYDKIMAQTGDWNGDIRTFLKYARKQQSLGREVKNFDKKVWDANCMDIVYVANYYKFSQNDKLNDLMMSLATTRGDQISFVEGSPVDKIWGIGLDWTDPRVFDKTQWKGENRLGQCLDRTLAALMAVDHD